MKKITLNEYEIAYEVFYRSKKYIRVRVKDGKLIVSAPPRTQQIYIDHLLKENKDKILKLLFPKVKEEKPIEPTSNEDIRTTNSIVEVQSTHFLGKEYMVVYLLGYENACYVNHLDIIIKTKKEDKKLQRKVLYDYYKAVVEKEIVRLLPQARLDFKEISLPVINVKDYKSGRLGVCRKVEGNYVITLSAKLAKYEPKYIKMVLYHELSHIFEMNHSASFYEVFESKYPNAKKTQKALKAIKYRDCI